MIHRVFKAVANSTFERECPYEGRQRFFFGVGGSGRRPFNVLGRRILSGSSIECTWPMVPAWWALSDLGIGHLWEFQVGEWSVSSFRGSRWAPKLDFGGSKIHVMGF